MKKALLLLVFAGCAYSPAAAPTTGVTTCPSSGSKAVLSKSAPTSFFVILSPVANTGSDIEIGANGVTTSTGLQLLPGQSYSPTTSAQGAFDLGTTYFACATNTDTIRWLYY